VILAAVTAPAFAQDPPGASAITATFNGTPIDTGQVIWFNSVLKVQGMGSEPVTVVLRNSTIQFSAGGMVREVMAPNACVTFSPTATLATTSFDESTSTWVTTVPMGLSGNTFLSAVGFPIPFDLPGGIKPVTWYGEFGTDTPGIVIQWKWAAAVYTQFDADHNNALGVKPVDANQGSLYANPDHAGTPEHFRIFVIGGARGGGGSNYTGSYSGTPSVRDPGQGSCGPATPD
jgi:hypothetical protein